MAGTLATLLAVLLWSFHAAAGELSVREVSPLQLTLQSYLLSMLFLGLWSFCRKPSTLRCLQDLGWGLILALVVSGPVLMLYYLALYAGMSLAPAVDVYIIHYLWPIFAALFVKLFLGRSWGVNDALTWILMLLAFMGAGMIVLGGSGQGPGSGSLHGYILAFISAVSGGLYLPALVLAGDRLCSRGYPEYMGFMIPYLLLIAGGMAAIALFMLFFDLQLDLGNASSWAGAAFIGLGVIVLAEMAWVFGVRWNRSQSTTALAYLTPVFSTSLLVFVTGQQLVSSTAYGLALVVTANMFLHLHSAKVQSWKG